MQEDIVAQHDELLDKLPEHDTAQCPICIYKENNSEEPNERGEMDTFTQEQVTATVEAAIAPLNARIAELEGAEAAADLASQISAAEAAADEKVTAAEADRDRADVAAAAAEQKYNDLIAYLEAAEAEAAEVALMEQRTEARTQAIKDQTAFSDEKIAERIGEWAKLSDEDFDARLAEWAELSGQTVTIVVDENGADAAKETAMRNVRDEASKQLDYSQRIAQLKAQSGELGVSLTQF